MTRADSFRLSLAAFALAFAAPALAEDSRLQTLVFDEAAVVRIDGKVKVQTTIKFAPDEVIENVAIGDSAALAGAAQQGADDPVREAAGTGCARNMTVVTDRRTTCSIWTPAAALTAPLYSAAKCGRGRG